MHYNRLSDESFRGTQRVTRFEFSCGGFASILMAELKTSNFPVYLNFLEQSIPFISSECFDSFWQNYLNILCFALNLAMRKMRRKKGNSEMGKAKHEGLDSVTLLLEYFWCTRNWGALSQPGKPTISSCDILLETRQRFNILSSCCILTFYQVQS